MKKNKLRVVFYLDKDEKELLNSHVKLMNMSVSNYVRMHIQVKLGSPIFIPQKLDFSTKQYNRKILGMANNLNQIAHHLNKGLEFKIASQQELLNTIDKLKHHILEVKSELSHNGK